MYENIQRLKQILNLIKMENKFKCGEAIKELKKNII